jgi:ParB/RepB/Spo0J family partition protein
MAVKKVIDIPLDQIDLGERGRQDFGDIEELASSIEVHGLLQPITVAQTDEDGGFLLVTGGRRYKAHEQLKLTHIDCLIREISGDADLAELELVENVHRKELTWQERCTMELKLMRLKGLTIRELAEEVDSTKSAIGRHVVMGEALEAVPILAECKSLHDAHKSLNKMREAVMADELAQRAEDEVHAMAEEDGEAISTKMIAPEELPDVLEKALTRSKSIVAVDELISHRLKLASACYQIGDCIESMAHFGQPGSFHFAEIDPPYGIDLKAAKKQEGSADGSDLNAYTEVDSEEYSEFLEQVADEVYVKLTTDAFAIFWFGPTHQHVTKLAIEQAGFTVNDVPGIWTKESGQTQQPSLNLANCYEPFYVARKGSPPLKKQGRSNVFQYKAEPGSKKYHPTQRPIALMEELLNTFVFAQKMRVLVPFLGSGVTIRAAFNLGMLATGWDLSEEYRDRFLLQVREDVKDGTREDVDPGSDTGEAGDKGSE